MRDALATTAQYGDADALLSLIRKTRDANDQRRLSAIRYRLLGQSAGETCTLLGITPSTLWLVYLPSKPQIPATFLACYTRYEV